MRAELRNAVDAYRAQLLASQMEQIPEIKSQFFAWYNAVSEEDREEMKPFWEEIKKEAWDIIAEIKEGLNELRALDEQELAQAKKS